MRLEDPLPGDRIGDAALVLQGDEGDIALARPLADQDDAGDLHLRAVLQLLDQAAGRDPAPLQLPAQEADRVVAERKLDGAIILHHLAARGQRGQRDFGLLPLRLGKGEERQRLAAAKPADLPERLPPVEPKRLEGVGIGQFLQRRRRHARAAPDIVDRGEGRVHGGRGDQRAMLIGQPLHLAETEPQREIFATRIFLQRAVPPAGVHAHGTHLHLMRARVADQLGGSVEAHGLGVEQSRAENLRMIIFHPGRGVGDLGEAGGVALGKAIAAEALDLLEGPLGEVLSVALGHHPADHILTEMAHPPGGLEGRHGAAQRVCLGRRETRADDRDLHRLLLKERHAFGLGQNLLQFIRRIFLRLLPLAPTEVGMDHIALNRPRPDDRDLDDDVVENARLEPREHRHLGPALDLERAERVGLAEHVIDCFVVLLQHRRPEVHVHRLVRAQQIEGAPHAAQHAEAEHIQLHDAQLFEVILLPFDHPAILHGRRLDRDDIVEPVVSEDEPARMLAEMAGRADQLPRQFQCQRKPGIVRVEAELRDMALGHALIRPAPYLAGKSRGHVFGETQRLADLADGAARPEAADDRGKRGMVLAIMLINPLDHLFPPLMLEIDIDIGRLVPAFRDEAFEQKRMPDRIDRGDVEHEADDRIGGRTAALAENALTARKADH